MAKPNYSFEKRMRELAKKKKKEKKLAKNAPKDSHPAGDRSPGSGDGPDAVGGR